MDRKAVMESTAAFFLQSLHFQISPSDLGLLHGLKFLWTVCCLLFDFAQQLWYVYVGLCRSHWLEQCADRNVTSDRGRKGWVPVIASPRNLWISAMFHQYLWTSLLLRYCENMSRKGKLLWEAKVLLCLKGHSKDLSFGGRTMDLV